MSVGDVSVVPGGAPERVERIVQTIHQVTWLPDFTFAGRACPTSSTPGSTSPSCSASSGTPTSRRRAATIDEANRRGRRPLGLCTYRSLDKRARTESVTQSYKPLLDPSRPLGWANCERGRRLLCSRLSVDHAGRAKGRSRSSSAATGPWERYVPARAGGQPGWAEIMQDYVQLGSPSLTHRLALAEIVANRRALTISTKSLDIRRCQRSSKRICRLLHDGATTVVLVGDGPDGLAVLRFRLAIWSEGLECYLAELMSYHTGGVRALDVPSWKLH